MPLLTNSASSANISNMKKKATGINEPRFVRQMTLSEFDALFPSEEACWTYLSRGAGRTAACPRCRNDHVYESNARPWHWQCKECGPKPRSPYRFSLRTGTIFEEHQNPLRCGSKFST